MAKRHLLFWLLILSLPLSAQDEYESDASFLSDSLTDYLDDYSMFLTEEMKNELLLLHRSKEDVSYLKVFSITSNELVSKDIYEKMFEKDDGLKITLGVYTDSLLSKRNKTFALEHFKTRDFREFALIEKDINEEKMYDNVKAGLKFKSILVGNYRVKTGRGLFSDYSSYYSSSDGPFYSDRVELDATYDEYPAYFGLAGTKEVFKTLSTGFLSYAFYDSRIDSFGNAEKILTYNNHDDSLAISRKDNLKGFTAGFVVRETKQTINLGVSYTLFSRNLIENKGEHLFLISAFGKKSVFSYDAAYSFNNGYALSLGAKREGDSYLVNSGLLLADSFFNPHAKTFSSKSSFFSAFVEATIKTPLRITNVTSFRKDERHVIKNELSLRPVRNFEINIKAKIDTVPTGEAEVVIKGGAKDILTAKNSYSVKTTGTLSAKGDATLYLKNVRASIFASYCSVAENDMVSVFAYSIESVYPIVSFYEGRGYIAGILMQVGKKEKATLSVSLSYDSSQKARAGFSISASF
ncbi:MAG: hypothetical protein PHW02_00850 [bacterium]|nr:hypothetical protein [bacterium]